MIFSVYYIEPDGTRNKEVNTGQGMDKLIEKLISDGYNFLEEAEFFRKDENKTYTWERSTDAN